MATAIARVDILTTPEVKKMLVEIALADSRSITKEVIYLIKSRHEELFGSSNEKN